MAPAKSLPAPVHELLLQMIETERGGQKVYTQAIEAAQNDDLREEWSGYLDETRKHERILTDIFEKFGLDTEEESPGRAVVRLLGESYVAAIATARKTADPAAAELVAAEAVVLAETKDHQNWELLGRVAKTLPATYRDPLKDAYDEVEKEEDHHLFHTQGWARELWIQFLEMPAVLPPPEEVRKVETAIGASRAEQARKDMM